MSAEARARWLPALIVLAAGLALAARLPGGSMNPALWLGLPACLLGAWLAAGRSHPGLMRPAALSLAPLIALVFTATLRAAGLHPAITAFAECLAVGAAVGIAAATWAAPLLEGARGLRRALCSEWVVWGLVALWCVACLAWTVLAWLRLEHFWPDLAIHEQAVYNTVHGRFLEYSIDHRYRDRILCRFGDHFEPTLLLFVPMYALWASPVWFLAAQVLVLGSAAVPLARLAREHQGAGSAGLALAFVWLINPGLYAALSWDFHMEPLAAPLIIWGIYLTVRHRFVAALLPFIVALGCKENIPGTVVLVGLWLAWRVNRRFGIALAALALVWGVVALGVVIPHYSPTGGTLYGRLFLPPPAPDGSSQLRAWGDLGARGTYLVELLGPVGGVCLLAPGALAISAPELALHLSSAIPWLHQVQGWYHVTVLVGVMLGAVIGLRWLRRRLGDRLAGAGRSRQAVSRAVLLGWLVACVWFLGSRPGLLTEASTSWFRLPGPEVRAVHELLDRVPDGAPVLTNDHALATHLARRSRLRVSRTGQVDDPAAFAGYEQVRYAVLADHEHDHGPPPLALRLGLKPLGRAGDVWLFENPSGPGR